MIQKILVISCKAQETSFQILQVFTLNRVSGRFKDLNEREESAVDEPAGFQHRLPRAPPALDLTP